MSLDATDPSVLIQDYSFLGFLHDDFGTIFNRLFLFRFESGLTVEILDARDYIFLDLLVKRDHEVELTLLTASTKLRALIRDSVIILCNGLILPIVREAS